MPFLRALPILWRLPKFNFSACCHAASAGYMEPSVQKTQSWYLRAQLRESGYILESDPYRMSFRNELGSVVDPLKLTMDSPGSIF